MTGPGPHKVLRSRELVAFSRELKDLVRIGTWMVRMVHTMPYLLSIIIYIRVESST